VGKFLFLYGMLPLLMLTCSVEKPPRKFGREFTNPILAGFYPDPSVCRVGNDYYLVNSTFAYFPGIPIFQSQDLVNWQLIGHVLDRAEQLDLEGFGVSRGIFAPAIRYHDGVYYVTCTLVDGGGNFVVTSQNPRGPWSNPVWIPQINGIDPSLFFDDDGQAYIVYNSIAPDNQPLYDGHRTIRMYQFDTEKLQVTGSEIILVNGGTDLSKKPIWIEGPHIFRKDGYYYLIAAEGGTGEQHSEVVFRSKNVAGPYVSYEHNPILTQRQLDSRRKNPITCTGHADFTITESGDWWAVFLGCRPYPPGDENYYNTGRETFLTPVKWLDGWPVINPDREEVRYHYPYPIKSVKQVQVDIPYSGNFKIKDDFESERLHPAWIFLRTPHSQWYNLGKRKGFLALRLRPETCADRSNPSFVGHRQQHLYGSVSTAMEFVPELETEKAGLLVFQNEQHFYFLCKSREQNNPVVQLYKSGNPMELLASQKIDEDLAQGAILLKITATGANYSFHYAMKPGEWILLKDNVDARFLSTRIAGGFVGCVYALYATASGKLSNKVAYFDWFEYVGDDAIYR